jgi:hypothetical protein
VSGCNEELRSHAAADAQGEMRSEQKLLGYSVSLLQAITTGDTMRRGGWGSTVDAGSHEGVVSNLTAALKVSITFMYTHKREGGREREIEIEIERERERERWTH